MCGMDVDLEGEGAGEGEEEEKEQEEEYDVGERVRMLPPPTAHSGAGVWGARRGPAGRLVWGAGLALWNAGVAAAAALLLAAVFTLVLLPATLLLSAGFLCHSRVLNSPLPLCGYLDDNSCSALIILGFVMMSPLVVLAAAMFCGLVRRLRLLLLFQPMSRACYRGGGGWGWGKNVRAWV
ncbi:transmembrane protein 88-like isoform X2 [Anguilla rostrata]|uniref:transmembrane protein 88 n=2 Tax=Anguilla TaxID=7935 RepID=UPI0015ADEDCF|nr:transmembrane protein 88 [Anguilla anguilla]